MEASAASQRRADRPACPKYLALARSFERQLTSGVLRVGDRLPSVRQLRATHRVSMATAVGCYEWLERQGYVRARAKSGFFVSRAPQPDGPAPVIASRARGPVPVQLTEYITEVKPLTTRSAVVELGSAVVGPDLLPMNRLNRSVRMALSAFGDHAIRIEHPRGNLRLRRQIARLIFRQGAACSIDDIVITSGSTEAIHLAIRAVAHPGDVIAVESPSCYETLHALEALQMRAVEIPHRPHAGIDLELLTTVAERTRVKALITNATCHNPTGDCVAEVHKAQLVAFATRRDIGIIEGDTFGELLFSGQRPRSLKSYDTAGVVIQCASLAHFVAPGFNLGWIHAGRYQSEVERLKAITNIGPARLPQLAMAEFLESGAFDKHLKQLRLALWTSVEATRQEVLRTFPGGTRVNRPEGGFVLWIQLPAPHDGLVLHERAAALGVRILPGAVFSPTGQYRDCIRISCGHSFEVMKPAIRTLAQLLSKG